ncbi:2-C-methyl-D-erythritol 4-phosphate cytidylyltransferase [Clostridium beijerinckii]|uniref:2-C-methyl-D-erythritol 4-phosphate cytidylyltransferase n=1 Tax=Clostridium beijerinckii TaxID=1520 RepID=UPI00098CE0AA|nr:2-C-methyl-D-erythritol 4-phosphate cytidylyltransferase [Clostridium beijerinckii]MBA8936128.1 2-C-methyl-D-erythritol 4-phosphate cytidylyltransferase [Clostridium beijerinckii]NRT32347.1 2-C-methyl-D-erythritol 4-phosphate cytidylyltransferase [Clostridium beijerinckii]NRT48225.1 2-C-methyl-D-erythritol 4-phosphate cytidylyltransferase [Clostridium beijerinckii]NRU36201.1 2-C-methyl-D-erythritol 4-phosphate cytidylyltransferase [Clostridium beijerinckii]NRZ23478.1 2-C-methyl-D-erythritol
MVSAIVLAGGRGKRMGYIQSKQYIDLNGAPILYYTLKQFIENDLIDKIILVVPEDEKDYCKREVLNKYGLKIDDLVSGGNERQESVYNALEKLEKSDVVLIHDGARPFVSQKIINDAVEYAKRYKAAAPGVMPKDTIKIKDSNNFSVDTLVRSELVAIQTPQAFDFNLIYECHKEIKKRCISVTDDTSVVELLGHKVYIYEGDYKNIKITTPEDLILAEYFVKNIV